MGTKPVYPSKSKWHLQKSYGITTEDYNSLLLAQGGVCKVCGEPETTRGKGGLVKPLAVDHDHESDTVRGLLCQSCNVGIGYFKDQPNLLRAAARYLKGDRR